MTDTPRALASQEASRPDPALGHPAAPGSTVPTAAPRSQPCALDRPELPVRLSDEAKDAARWQWLSRREFASFGDDDNDARWAHSFDDVEALNAAIDAALSAQGNGGTA